MLEKRQEHILAGTGLFLMLGLVLNLFLLRTSHLLALSGVNAFLLIAAIVTMLTYLRVRLARLSGEEKKQNALARTEQPESALFEVETDTEPFTMARSREQFERFFVPAMTPLLAGLLLFLAWHLFHSLGALRAEPSRPLLVAAFLSGQGFLFFLLSRYTMGLSQADEQRLLRAPGIYLGLACFAALIAAVSAIAPEFGLPQIDHIAVWILLSALGLLGLENILNALGQVYRPRHRTHASATPYESRIGALLTDPGSWVKNVAQAMDYQFGFNVSDTWFYRFLANALLPLIIFQILALYFLSCLVFLGPEEEGILEHFGQAPQPTQIDRFLDSGFHLKWPWPFETVRRFSTKRIQTIHVGHKQSPDEHDNFMLWTVPHHASKEMFLVANQTQENQQTGIVPVNLLSVHMPVQYRITNIYYYAYHHAEPDKLLEQIAYRNITREAVGRGLFEMVGEGQLEVTHLLQKRLQEEADRLQMGIQITFVGLQGLHPPVAVADAFESVIAATEEKEATLLQAYAYTNRIGPIAHAQATASILAAEAYQHRRITLAAAEAYQFEARLKGYGKAPQVFRNDIYLRTLRDALLGTRKYIISATPSSEVIQFNFEEKSNPDLFDLSPEREGRGL